MKKLSRLVNCLKPAEIQLIKDYYQAKFGQEPPKRLLLLNLLLEGQVTDNAEIANLLYRQQSGSALSKLKERLREDLLNFFLLFPLQKLPVSALFRTELGLRKQLLQAKILLARGEGEESMSIVKKVTQTAAKYELPEISLVAKEMLRSNVSTNDSHSASSQYLHGISDDLLAYEKILKAKEFRRRFARLSQESDNTNLASDTVRREIKQWVQGASESSSGRIQFWSQLVSLTQYMNQTAYRQAKACGENLIQLIDSDPFLCTIPEKSGIYTNISKSLLYLGELKQAQTYAKKAVELCHPHTEEESRAMEHLFFAYFRNTNISQAQKIASQAIRRLQTGNQGFLQRKWQLLLAGAEFRLGQYDSSLKRLRDHQGFLPVDGSWVLGNKLLELLNIVEIKDFDWFEYKIETFRKALYKLRNANVQRYQLIFRILSALCSNSFDFPQIWIQQHRHLSLLQEGENPYQWDACGHEVIHFFDWMKQKTSDVEKNLNLHQRQ